jgi:DNA (cytosine-5)-methyltransferase 1
MTHGSLFSGIGGFELAARWAGIETLWSNEIDPFCCAVLRKNFKHEIIEQDIKKLWPIYLKPVDILTGGFPCQPFSVAGKKLSEKDTRYLWPEMLKFITELKPKIVIGENVVGFIELAFDKMYSQMEQIGYQTEAYIIPACAIDAPHRRDRIWIISYANGCDASRINTTLLKNNNIKKWSSTENIKNWNEWFNELDPGNVAQRFDTYSGALRILHGIPNRVDRTKSLGNAIVPQVAYEIFKAIEAINLGLED